MCGWEVDDRAKSNIENRESRIENRGREEENKQGRLEPAGASSLDIGESGQPEEEGTGVWL